MIGCRTKCKEDVSSEQKYKHQIRIVILLQIHRFKNQNVQSVCYIVIMRHSRITEQDQRSSMSLHDHTLIQVYDQLDYSDEEYNDSSSQDRSLSLSRQHQLAQLNQPLIIKDPRTRHHHRLPSHAPVRIHEPQRRHLSDLESKYDLGISPSTKQQYSILKANEQPQRRGFAMRIEESQNLHKGRSIFGQQFDVSSQRSDEDEKESSEESIESGRKAHLGSMKPKKQFNINSFLNAQPIAPKSKKGVSVLTQIQTNALRDKARPSKPKHHLSPSKIIPEQESISLITLPEVEESNKKRLEAIIRRGEAELCAMGGWQRRLQQVRLNFMDCFLPQPLKIKSNPYNLLKYMNARIRI